MAMTLPLLFMGGVVTSLGVGLAVPDWPTTFGYNMFLYPWSKMVGGIFYEHSHRLLGSAVGLLTIVLAVVLWLTESGRRLRWLGVIALVGVVTQGVLGGLRVVLVQNSLAVIHACVAQAFFALLAGIALMTSPEWHTTRPSHPTDRSERTRHLALTATLVVYLQLMTGAVLRHTGSGIAVHLLGAAAVFILIIHLTDRMFRLHPHQSDLLRSGRLLRRLLGIQLGLGLAAYVGVRAAPDLWSQLVVVLVSTAHVVVGALTLVTVTRLTLRVYRLFGGPQPIVSQLLSEQAPA